MGHVLLDESGRRQWEACYAEHAASLLRFLLKLTGEYEVACDLLQETFVRAMRNKPERPIASKRAWLFRVGLNLARDGYRRNARLRFVPLERAGELASREEAVALVHDVLKTLPAREASALLLHYEAGFSRAEIADMEGIHVEAIKSRLRRGRAHFMAAYRRLAEAEP